ncbi:MAG TPA: BatD family protein [Luteimonas sp.]|nr:BatD family protein [Luteimonas sp.]
MSRALNAFVITLLSLLLTFLLASTAQAQTRAWLDRDRIALGETATLNVETDQPGVDAPDYAPLLGDYTLSGNSSSQQYENVNGVGRSRTLFAVALQPKRDGVIGIPGLRIGNQRTQPLTLTVTPSAAVPAHAGSAVFIEAETDAQEPYVQQAVGYSVRLYYATPLISGQLDQDPPEGASLQKVGDDVQYTRDMAGQRYTVVERHYQLIPEHSGTLTIPGARFQGRGAGGFFDELFGDGQRDLRANGPPHFLRVRAIPANAPQPWLPLRALTLRYLATPQAARAGEAVTVTVEASADGANAAQMPELQLQASGAQAGVAQVFADPLQADETFRDGRPQVRIARKFSIVPAQAGSLRISGPRLAWWDVRAGIARTAALPDITLQVAPGANGFGAAPAAAANAPVQDADRGWIRVPGVQGAVRPWAFATVLFAALWLLTFMWGLHRRPSPQPTSDNDGSTVPASATAHATQTDLRRALDNGDLGDVADALCAMASPPVADPDALRSRLADPAQLAAIESLQRARWAGGDGVAARAALREAFKRGPRWHAAESVAAEPLPPLYPQRKNRD